MKKKIRAKYLPRPMIHSPDFDFLFRFENSSAYLTENYAKKMPIKN